VLTLTKQHARAVYKSCCMLVAAGLIASGWGWRVGPVTTHTATEAYITGLSAATLRSNMMPAAGFGEAAV
jgi:hypothetical protein